MVRNQNEENLEERVNPAGELMVVFQMNVLNNNNSLYCFSVLHLSLMLLHMEGSFHGSSFLYNLNEWPARGWG